MGAKRVLGLDLAQAIPCGARIGRADLSLVRLPEEAGSVPLPRNSAALHRIRAHLVRCGLSCGTDNRPRRKVPQSFNPGNSALPAPGLIHFRMMVSGVVTHVHDALAFLSVSLPKEFHEIPEALPVKSIRLARMNKLAVAHAPAPKYPTLFAGGKVAT
jgi:hypothetical protein